MIEESLLHLNRLSDASSNNLRKKWVPLSQDDLARKDEKLKKATKMFEGYMVSMLLKEMRKSVQKSSFAGVGDAEKLFTDMFDQHLSDQIAKSGGFGLAEAMYRQLKLNIDLTNSQS